MTTRRRLLAGAISAFLAVLSAPKASRAADARPAGPLHVTYYFLPG